MTTPLDIINAAAKKAGILGVGQALLAEDVNDAFNDVNDLMAQWQQKRWLVYHLVTYGLPATGALSYSVGPGQDFNVPATPRKLESAFFRQIITSQPNQIDYPLEILNAMEDYNNITLKELITFPRYIFYDSGFPNGTVYPWPVLIANTYSLFLTFRETLPQFTSLAQTIVLPPEYMAALKWNLAERLRVNYSLPENKKLESMAKDSLNVIRNANNQIPRMRMPRYLIRRGIYNIYSDQSF